MSAKNRFSRVDWWRRLVAELRGETETDGVVLEPETDPGLQYIMRPVRPVSPEMRLGEAFEYLRAGNYPLVAVVEAGELRGVLTEQTLVAALLAADAEERRQLRELPVHALMDNPTDILTPHIRASEAALRLDIACVEALPVISYQGQFLGMVSRADLVDELSRPFKPPMIGGMATPQGVYLVAGTVAGGVGAGALFLTGLLMSLAYILAALLTLPLQNLLYFVPQASQTTVQALLQSVVQMGLFLGFVRFSPMAGYHAAEHQTVHAVERGEPLLVDVVREMPRVHPRCGTNLVAGGAIFGTVGLGLEPLLSEFSYLLSGLLALTYWRTFGAWLQEYVTTRPATDTELESGIHAAQEVLTRYTRTMFTPVKPHVRLWRAGFLQVLAGFGVGFGIAYLLTKIFPAQTGPLHSVLQIL